MVRRVLVIDDEEDMRVLAQVFLELSGQFEVVVAESARQGCELAATIGPDAILLDYMMPEMSGAEAYAQLKNDPRTRNIPIIFLTGKAHSSTRDELEALDIAGIIAKPFDPSSLADEVTRALAQQRPK